MFRNKLIYIFLVFFFAGLFITGLIAEGRQTSYARTLTISGQTGLGAAIVLFLLLPHKTRKDSR